MVAGPGLVPSTAIPGISPADFRVLAANHWKNMTGSIPRLGIVMLLLLTGKSNAT